MRLQEQLDRGVVQVVGLTGARLECGDIKGLVIALMQHKFAPGAPLPVLDPLLSEFDEKIPENLPEQPFAPSGLEGSKRYDLLFHCRGGGI